jgi:hypothetical protein
MCQTEALAVFVRLIQWELDEAAFEIGGGRYTAEQRERLAERLARLASMLKSPNESMTSRSVGNNLMELLEEDK